MEKIQKVDFLFCCSIYYNIFYGKSTKIYLFSVLKMNRFIQNIIYFFLILVLTSIALIIANFYLVRNLNFNNNGKHILLLGDSNIECAINDSIYDNSVNRAKSGNPYFYSYLKLNYIISISKNIDTVFLAFAPHNIFANGWLFNNKNIYSCLQLYYPIMPICELKFLLDNNSKAAIFAIQGMIKRALINIFISKERIIENYGCYLDLNRSILNEVIIKLDNGEKMPFFEIPDNFTISSNEILYFNKIIELCYLNSIELYLINTPKRKELLNYKKYGLKEFYDFYRKNYANIIFFDFSKFLLQDSCYGDLVHLNRYGAIEFSNFLKENSIEELKNQYGIH